MRFSKIEIALIVIASDDDSVFAAKLFLQLLVNLVGETRWRDAGGWSYRCCCCCSRCGA